ncbi:MAG: DUF2937 family protein [Bacteroidia bacterium]|nr:DUF2937 family protein [Bacteroidia bacterium]
MSFLTPIAKYFGTIADRIICVVFAVVFAQVPVYIAQYIDVLSGAQMESQKMYDDLVGRAQKYELTIEEFLERLKANPDVLVKENAEASESAVNRYKNYTDALNALLHSSVWSKPFRLMKHYDPSIHSAMQFEPNLPLTGEGLIYALLGVVVAVLLIGLISSLFRVLFKRKKTEKAV